VRDCWHSSFAAGSVGDEIRDRVASNQDPHKDETCRGYVQQRDFGRR
jgi:hypothetical protein